MARFSEATRRVSSASAWITVFKNLVWVRGFGTTVVLGTAVLLLTTVGPLAAAVALACATLIFGFGIGIAAHRALANRRNSPPGFRLEKYSAFYTIDPKDIRNHTYTVARQVTAKRNDVHLVDGRYRWSGSGGTAITSTSLSTQILDLEMNAPDGWHYFIAVLPAPLSRGAEATIETVQVLDDPDGLMKPWLTMSPTDYVGQIQLGLSVPPQLIDKGSLEFTEERWKGSRCVWSERVPFETTPDGSVHTGAVPHPRRGHTYAFRWTWADYKQRIHTEEIDLRTTGL